jgi:hypothetical protein
MTLEGLHYSQIWYNIGRSTLGRNFDVTIVRALREASSAMWNLCTNSAFVLGSRKTTENLDRVGRTQDLPDANWLLATRPAVNMRNLTIIPIWLLLYLKKEVFIFVFTDLPFYVRTLDEQQPVVHKIWEDNLCLYEHTYLHIYINLYLWLFEYWWIWISIVVVGGIGCYMRFVAHSVAEDCMLQFIVHFRFSSSAILSRVGNWSMWPPTDWMLWGAFRILVTCK